MKRTKSTYLAFLAVLLSPMAAHAVPIEYQIDFGPAGPLTGGTGGFTWDDDTQLVSNLTWDFGSGLTGGANPNWAEDFGSGLGTLSQFFFEIMTRIDVSPISCTAVGTGCVQGFSSFEGLYGWPGSQMSFLLDSNNDQTYFISDPDYGSIQGTFSTRLVSVAEPGTLALLGLGLFGIGVARRRRQS